MKTTRWPSAVVLSILCGLVFAVCGSAAEPAPVVVDRTPARGEELRVEEAIELVFDRPMDRASVQGAFALFPSVAGSFSWPDDRTVRFRPAADWPRETAFSVTVATEAKDPSGQRLSESYRFAFRTVGYLVVTQVIPASGTEKVAAESTITLFFNRPVVPLVAVSDPAASTLPRPLFLTPAVEGRGEWLNTSVYVFTPARPLRGGTAYVGRVRAGLADTTGGVLAEDFVFSFSTEPPRVVWASPNEGEEPVPVDAAVRITFNMPIDAESARRAFTLRRAGSLYELLGLHVEGTVGVAGSVLTFTPSSRLEFATQYVVSVAQGVESVGGGAGMAEATVWQFTTVPLPRIVATDPKDGESRASPYTSFSIRFNAPVVPESVEANVAIEPAPRPDETSTYFREWDNTFVISFGAKPSTSYVVRVGPGIRDRYGNTTGQSMTVGFRTRALDPAAWLNVSERVGTYNAYQVARVFVAYRNTDRLDFSLYRLSLEEYFGAEEDWYSFTPSPQGRVRRWSVNVQSKENELGYAAIDLVRGGGALEPGIYLLDLGAEGVEYDRWAHRHVLVASTVNLTLKTDDRETLVWATDLETGTPVSFLPVAGYDEGGNRMAAATTDGNGLARFPSGDRARPAAVAGEGPFTLGSPFWTDGISPWEFGFDAGYLEDARAHIDTDRPIYRPGQSVHFRGVVRLEDDARYRLPGAGTVEVKVYDAAWELVFDASLPLDSFGTFSGDVTLAAGAALGEYRVQATLGDATFSGSFQVAAYRPPEFEVTVAPEKDEIARGEETGAAVQVRYFFGGPVKDAPVEWNVLSGEYRFQPPQFDRYRFTDEDDPWVCFDCWWRRPEPPLVILSGSGMTEADGALLVEIPAEATAGPSAVQTQGSRILTVEATVRGADGQTLSGRGTVVLHRGDFYVGLSPRESVGRAGDEMRVDLVAVDWEGRRLPERSLEYLLYRRDWTNTFVKDEAGGGRWEWTTNDVEVTRGTLSTDAAGEGVLTFIPPEGGSYKAVVRGNDAGGRRVQSSVFVWASGKEYVSWRRTNDDRIALVSDKPTYVPGETAKILIPSPFSGETWALVTVERGSILCHEVILLESNSTVYELPITADYVPNVYVGVVLVEGRARAQAAAAGAAAVASHKVGYVSLTVEPVPQRLHIAAASSAVQALPGSQVSFDLSVTDSRGDPVEASLAVDLVDKSILTLRPRAPEAIVEAFYGFRGLGVMTSSGLAVSIDRLLLEQLRQAATLRDAEAPPYGTGELQPARLLAAAPEGGAEGMTADGVAKSAASQLPAGIALREEFADTAYWNAQVVTGPDGKARVQIDLPDNLTTWVFRAVGTSRATQVGEATDELLVTKPLLVRPVTPRFFVVGDRVELAALVNNNTARELVAGVTLGSVGLALESGVTQTVSVPAAAEAKVTWWATVEDVPQVDLAVSAVAGDYSDAARPRLTTGPEGTLRVFRYTAPEIVGTAGELVGEGTRTEIVALPPRYDDRRGELAVELDPSLAAGMREGLTYLEHFEYECTEQVVSRFLPNVLTYRALVGLGIQDATLEAKLPGLVEEGLSKLYVEQHEDGGWGWWWNDSSSPYLTAYVVFALTKTREAGFEVHDGAVERGLDFLEGELVSARELDSTGAANRQAWVLYVLAEAGRTKAASEWTADLFASRGKLAHYARAYFALALSLVDPQDGRVATLLSDVENAAILSATGAHWEEKNYDFWAMNTDTRSTAVILEALARLDPQNPLIPNVVRWLMVARREGIWETTQETAWALIALTDWMVLTGELNGRYDYGVTLNGTLLSSGNVTPETVGGPIRLTVDVAQLLKGVGNRLTIDRGPGEGRLYYTSHLKVYLPVEDLEPLDRGISVSRQYVPAGRAPGEAGVEIDRAAVGESVQVRLTIVASRDLYYVVVEDPLPAGAEAIDPSLATTSRLEQEPGLFRDTDGGGAPWRWLDWWWWRWYSRSELRDEKVVLFADYLPAGTYTYQYAFRATQAGEYRVIPTSAQEFYFPEVFGRAAGRLFTVTEGK